MAESAFSKAAFKARVLEILRQVETTGEAVIVTDRGRPVVRVEPYFGGDDASLASLRGSVLEYKDPLQPVDQDAWEALA
ncbi:MAG: type II toxin-antitoxin system Phd/YefM family antitoxin [Chloroflexota bacterium]